MWLCTRFNLHLLAPAASCNVDVCYGRVSVVDNPCGHQLICGSIRFRATRIVAQTAVLAPS
jgi:hypothetical protein